MPKPAEEVKILIKNIRAGCSQSREDLASMLIPIIKPIVGKYYSGFHDKASATNYIVAKVFTKLDYFDLEKPVLNYIKLLANNYCIDEYRKDKKRKAKLIFKDNEVLDTTPNNEYSKLSDSLTDNDYRYLYSLIHSDSIVSDIIYDLNRTQLTNEEIAAKYSKGLDEIEKIQYFSNKKLRVMRKKAMAL